MRTMSDTENPPEAPRREKLNIRTVGFDEQERRAARAKAERDAREMAERKRAEFAMKVAVTEKLTEKLPRDGMAPVFFAAARRIAMEILLGNIPIRNGSDAGAAIKALTDAGRVEAGSIPDAPDLATPPATREEAEARLKLIHDEVAKRRAEVQQQQASGE
jgi:hypothetical protein